MAKKAYDLFQKKNDSLIMKGDLYGKRIVEEIVSYVENDQFESDFVKTTSDQFTYQVSFEEPLPKLTEDSMVETVSLDGFKIWNKNEKSFYISIDDTTDNPEAINKIKISFNKIVQPKNLASNNFVDSIIERFRSVEQRKMINELNSKLIGESVIEARKEILSSGFELGQFIGRDDENVSLLTLKTEWPQTKYMVLLFIFIPYTWPYFLWKLFFAKSKVEIYSE